ncbi:MAG: M28 family peptidase [Candidatus Bathyarchaeia archaeon]
MSKVFYHNFNVTVPVDYGATIKIASFPDLHLNIYPMIPNLIIPVTTKDLSGPLVYISNGELKDLNGKKIDGSIVLMNYNTGRNWINAAKFGAKAVIFIEPEDTSFFENIQKSVDLPFNFPRFYMPRKDAETLLTLLTNSETLYVNISSKVVWEEKISKNVIALLEGTEYNDIIILSAHYDSYSTVLSLAPGANDALGVATLMEIARLLTLYKPKYTLLFVAFSGHYQGLSGSRWFIEDFFFKDKNKIADIGSKVILQINLQFSSLTDKLVTANVGPTYWVRQNSGFAFGPERFANLEDYVLNLISEINLQIGRNYKLFSGAYVSNLKNLQSFFPLGLVPNDCEPLSLNLGPGYSIMTADCGDYRWSPIDTFEKLNLNNLKNNVEAVSCLVFGISQSHVLLEVTRSLSYGQMRRLGYSISGIIASYNESSASYNPVPGALVHVRFVTWTAIYSYMGWVVKANEQGRIYIPQITSGTSGGGDPYYLLAFVIDDETGNPIYCPTLGQYQWTPWGIIAYGKDVDFGYYTIFEGGTIVLFDLFYPPTLTTIRKPIFLGIFESPTHTSPSSFGYSLFIDNNYGFSMGVAYVPSNTPVEIVINTPHLGSIPLAFLLNTSSKNREGLGFKVDVGEQNIITFTPLHFAEDLYYLSTVYLDKLERFGIATDLPERLKKVKDSIESIKIMLANTKYDEAWSLSIETWRKAHAIYQDLRNLIVDTSNSIVFFGLVIIPFTFLIESIIFETRGRKKILSLSLLYSFILIIFYLVHPSFYVAANPMMVIIGFTALFLASPLIGILFNNFLSFVQKVTIKKKGKHFIITERGSKVLLSFSVAVANLKKRKLRTSLTLITISLIIFSLVSFSSIYGLEILRPGVTQISSPYHGVYVRTVEWDSVGVNIINILETKYLNQGIILPRAWKWTTFPDDSEHKVWFKAWHDGASYAFYGILGLTPYEIYLDWPRIAIIEGMWFNRSTEKNVCILPEIAAKKLGIKLFDKIDFLGKEWTIIGIINSTFIDLMVRDMDAEGITLWDQTIPNQNHIHVSCKATIIVPFATLLHYNPTFSSVSIVTNSSYVAHKIASEIFETFNELYLFFSFDDKVALYTYKRIFSLLGWQMQVVPMLLGSIIILNLMISAVYERRKEIFTYATIGLSPRDIGYMFLVESMVYAIIGSTLGYLIATVVCRVFTYVSPAMFSFNYSSNWVFISMSLSILMTFLSTLYPLYLTGKIVTPSLERAWRIPTKPIEDEWDIPFPFTLSDEKEAEGVCLFIMEYLRSHGMGAEIFSVLNVSYHSEPERKIIKFIVQLQPYEQGIKQEVYIFMVMDPDTKKWTFSLHIKRISGPIERWVRLNRRFIDEFRKQLLIWSFLSLKEKFKYYGSTLKEEAN